MISKSNSNIVCDDKNELLLEIIQDAFLSYWIFSVQKKCDNVYLKELLGYLGLMTCSVFLNELFKSDFVEKEDIPEDSKKILDKFRDRLIKQEVHESKKIKKIALDMGIDHDHYCYDVILTVNTKMDNELLTINFSLWDVFNMDKEEIESFSSLANIPEIIIKYLLRKLSGGSERLFLEVEKYCIATAMTLEKIVVPEKYQYASSVFFKDWRICEEDINFILFYYTYSKLIYMIDTFVPFDGFDFGNIHIDFKYAKMKLKSVFIETIGKDIGRLDTPVVNNICSKLESIDNDFYHCNRELRNNIHYGKKTIITDKELSFIEKGQTEYLQTLQKVFLDNINYNLGTKYKIIKWVADHTDSNVRKKKEEV